MARHETVPGEKRTPTTQALSVQNIDGIKAMFAHEKVVKQLAGVIPTTLAKSLNPDRITRLAMIAILKSDRLQQCAPESIVSAVVTLTAWGLECSGVTGEAYLVPFRNKSGKLECTPIPGYQGLITLALRSEHVLSISAQLVYENDSFRMNIGDNSPVLHEQSWEERGRLMGGYAVAYLRGGGVVKERMTLSELNAVRDRSPSYKAKSGPWMTDEEQMYRKTLIRRISKYIPKSPELAEAFAAEDNYENVIDAREKLIVAQSQPFGFGGSQADENGVDDVEGRREDQSDVGSETDGGGASAEERPSGHGDSEQE